MDKFTLFHFYLIFFLVGLGYAVIAFLLGQVGGHEMGGHDPGGHEAAAGGDHDFSHDSGHDHAHGEAHGVDVQHELGDAREVAEVEAGDAMPNISPLSPVTVATFVTSFGGVGAVLVRFHVPGLVSVPVACGSGFVMAGAVFYLFYRVFSVTQGSSDVSVRHLIGREAEVITPIPANGLGEVAYVMGGRRFNAAARTEDGRALPHGTLVSITQVKNGRCLVTESVAERLGKQA